MQALNPIRIVLIGTTHPGNIGAAARAMKTMGLSDLRLVAPARFPDPDATARAAGADDILAQATVHATLGDALTGCLWVAGTSARLRGVAEWPVLMPEQGAEQALQEAALGPVALVFGRERSGLTNEELDRCHALLHIPANEAYSSLNLAAAVQITSYECRRAAMALEDTGHGGGLRTPPASVEALEAFYEHLELTLRELDFAHDKNAPSLLRKLRRLYARARPTDNEVQILRGVLSACQGGRSMRSRSGDGE